ncbi:uncharacterized protein LOC115668749 [Syzygium oleosum]|uniref:uncharacterized protein LOC115668749 n=1 Tax=Syzygium oleosum TaxID=219896 RepID=UPI0024B9D809|nr:uncharacterized protein LOC115668749 [Syzygium oleosum]
MAPLPRFGCRRVALVLLCVAVVFLGSFVFLCAGAGSESRIRSEQSLGAARRRLLEVREVEDGDDRNIVPKKKAKPTTLATTTEKSKNQTKLAKSTVSAKNQTNLMKPKSILSSKNQTRPLKPTNSTKKASPTSTILDKSELKKLNSTLKLKKLNTTSKASNSTKGALSLAKKSSDLGKLAPPENKTKESQLQLSKKLAQSDSKKQSTNRDSTDQEPKTPKTQKPKQPNWLDSEENNDLVSEFRDLPTKFQQTLIPDLERISTTSKAYLTQANKQMTKGFKPYVGNKYAPTIATLVSCAFILIPLVLVSLVFNRIKAYFSLQKLLIFVQVYLSIYFSILCLSSLATGLEPLRFFYATSRSTYVCIQIFQTFGYVLYLLLLLMYLVLVFSTDTRLGSKFLGLVQTFVGFAVGLHYYVAVFHRMVLHQPPRTNWKVHGVYAVCFLAICLFARAERRKKAYLEDGGEEGKKS